MTDILLINSGDESGVDKALLAGFDVNSKDAEGVHALHVATVAGQDNIVDYLLKHGADVNATDVVYSTALHRAAEKSLSLI